MSRPHRGWNVAGFGETAVWGTSTTTGGRTCSRPYYAYAPPYRSFLYHNNGNGTFTDVAVAAGWRWRTCGGAEAGEGRSGGLATTTATWTSLREPLFRNDGRRALQRTCGAQAGLPQEFDEGAKFVDIRPTTGTWTMYLRTGVGAPGSTATRRGSSRT